MASFWVMSIRTRLHEHRSWHLRASARTLSSPSAQAWVTIWHMHPTIAAVEALSAPPERGKRYPAAPADVEGARVSKRLFLHHNSRHEFALFSHTSQQWQQEAIPTAKRPPVCFHP